MSEVKNKGMRSTGPRVRSWKVYYLGKLFEDVGIKHSKPVRARHSVHPGAFVTGKSGRVKRKHVKPVPLSDFGEVLTGVRHIIRQSERLKFDKKVINRAWNRFSLLRNLPDSKEIVFESKKGGKLLMSEGDVLTTGKSLPKDHYIHLQALPQHLKRLHRNVRREGITGHIVIPSPNAYERNPYKVNVQPIWIGPQFGLRSFKGQLKEEYFHTLPYSAGNVVRRTWTGPPLTPYFIGLVNRMRRYRSKVLTDVMSHTIKDTTKALKKRKFIARCTRKAIRVMQLFTLHGHNMRAKLLAKIGPDKYKLIRRLTRIMRRRQTKFLARRENLKFHRKMKVAGIRRRKRRAIKRRARSRFRRPPGLHSPYFHRSRKARRPVKLVYRIRPGKEARYITIDEAKRVNLGSLKPRSLINNRKLRRTLSIKTTSARVKGNKRMSDANKTG